MWWNLVARTPDELASARRDREEGSDRFGTVESPLARTPRPSRGARREAPDVHRSGSTP